MRSVGVGWSESHRFPNGPEQLDRDPDSLAQLLECRVGERAPSVVRRRVDEVERDQITAESLAEPVEWETGVFQHLDDSNPLRASRPKVAIFVGLEDPQLRQALDDTRVDTGQVGDLLSCC